MNVDGMNQAQTQQQQANKKKRLRPRTAQIRQDLRKVLETAILSSKCKILPLFYKKDGVYSGNLYNILKSLNPPEIESFLKLNSFALKSLNNRTRTFMICGGGGGSSNDTTTKPENLKIQFSTKLRAKVMDTIAYVDNLPLLSSAERLFRRASVFGRVVDVYLPPPRRISQKQQMLRGSFKVSHAGYGFVQFTSPQAVKRFCKRYIVNSHLRRHGRSKTRRKQRARAFSKSQEELSTNSHNAEEEDQDQEFDPNNISIGGAIYEEQQNSGNFQMVEWSGHESGLESDFEYSKRYKSVTFNMSYEISSSKEENIGEENEKTKMPNKNRKTRRKKSAIGEAVSLKVLFRGIQVFPFRAYRRLKKEYYHLKKRVRQAYTIEAAGNIQNNKGGEESDDNYLA